VTPETLAGRLARSMNAIKQRSRTIKELAAECAYLNVCRPLHMADSTLKPLDNAGRALLSRILPVLGATEWTKEQLDYNLKMFTESEKIKTGKAFQPLRAALTGGLPSPGVYDILLGLGRSESIARIQDQAI
jgi:glutamyl-tRNA synthetase